MALVLADVGADALLNIIFNNVRAAGGNDFTLKLFTTNITPADTDTAATYSGSEASGGGYAAQTLTNGSWTITAANDPSDAVHPQVTFTFTGPLTGNATIYGYWVEDADGTLLWAEQLSTPFTPANNGDQLKITPVFQMSKGTPT